MANSAGRPRCGPVKLETGAYPLRPLHVACVLGTRPEGIKLAPIVLAARAAGLRVTIVATGQHRDMAAVALVAFGLAADVDLGVMESNQQPTDVLARVLLALPPALDATRPDVVLVQGDTSSTLAGALCAFHAKIPVGHVEAGLRTGDRYSPFPEEMNRRLTSAVSTFHFAPTPRARARLLEQGIAPETVLVTGNTVVDALGRLRSSAVPPAGVGDRGASRLLLLTCHRRENHGARLEAICGAIRDLVSARPDVIVACPVHPNPNVEVRMHAELDGLARVRLLAPVRYAELLWLLEACTLVLTDSGGLQEEAPTFGKPVLVLRDTTERPEGIEAGAARLVGTGRDAIVRATLRLLDDAAAYRRMAEVANPYGDGHASGRIVQFLLEHVRGRDDRAARPAAIAPVLP